MPTGEKSERATAKKRRDERKKGNIFLSNDAVTVSVLLAGFAVLFVTGGLAIEKINDFFHYIFNLSSKLQTGQLFGILDEIIVQILITLFYVAGPFFAACIIAALGATFLQTKLLFAPEAIKPKFSKLNPLEGFKRLFSIRSIVDAVKGLLKIGLLLFIIYNFISGIIETLARYFYLDLRVSSAQLFNLVWSMVIQICIAYIALAAADFFYQWWDYERKMRMTKQEVKEEYRQMEGDPKIKGKIKEMQRKLAQSRMMQQVKAADVIIKNPTHFAVALRYKPDKDTAPIVLAKGQDEMAKRILKEADEHGIKTVENKMLARALYAACELNRAIPMEFYNAVAEVLVYIYDLNKGGDKKPIS